MNTSREDDDAEVSVRSFKRGNNNDDDDVHQIHIDGHLFDSSAICAVLRDTEHFNNRNYQQHPKNRGKITIRNVSIGEMVLQGFEELFNQKQSNNNSNSTSSSSNKPCSCWTNRIDMNIIHCSDLVSKLIRIVLPWTEQFRFTGSIPIAHNLDSEGLKVIGKHLGGNNICTNNFTAQDHTAGNNSDNENENEYDRNRDGIVVPKLKTLSLKGTCLESIGFVLFCEGLGINNTLESLQLSNCTIENDDVGLLASALRENKHLKSLFLANCNFGRRPYSLSTDTVATQSINNINPQIHLPIVLEALIRHPTLQSLKIYDMHCNDQSMRAISDILLSSTGTKLLHLGLKNNLSHPESKLNVENLFQALTHSRYLTYLKISGNNLNDEDMATLSRILTTEESNIITSIKTLSVTDNLISDEGLLTLASRLSYAKSLKYLDVQRNPVTDRSKKAMVSALKNNVQIERLDLDGSWDTEKFWWLSLNRGGRRALQITTDNNNTVSSNLWPKMLERVYNLQYGRNKSPTNIEVAYYIIRRMPSLFEKVAAIREERRPNRKRQREGQREGVAKIDKKETTKIKAHRKVDI
jgi:Ran GTPase-activating protein (RanGAP) involved in mRNA processing and transport